MAYEIDLATVAAVVNSVRSAGSSLSEGIDGEALSGDVGAVASAPAPGVAQALADYLGREVPVVEGIGHRISGCLLGVSAVARSYTTASDEMLQTVQSHAVQAAESGDFSFFEEG